MTKRQSSWLVSRDRARVGDARVVEDHVHVAEHPKRLIGEVLDVVELAHVADARRVCRSPSARRIATASFSAAWLMSRKHHPGAAARELLCRGEADAVRSAGDDCCALVEILHGGDTTA